MLRDCPICWNPKVLLVELSRPGCSGNYLTLLPGGQVLELGGKDPFIICDDVKVTSSL